MRLLITTQAVDQNDPVLGFFVGWLERFAQQAESIEVICLRKGEYSLPPNVQVHELGDGGKLKRALRFVALTWKLRANYDAVFVHMNPEYMVLAGMLWRALNKPAVLWYTHRNVDLKLRIANVFARRILTASSESLRLTTRKKLVMGHGIDTSQFFPTPTLPDSHTLVTIGRISRAKGLETMLDAVAELPEPFKFTVVGTPATPEDSGYARDLATKVIARRLPVTFAGAFTHAELPEQVRTYGLFLHASRGTGSLDKAVLEAFAAGVPVVSTSPAFSALLEPHGLAVTDAQSMREAIERYAGLPGSAREELRARLRAEVVEHHSLESLIPRILSVLDTIAV